MAPRQKFTKSLIVDTALELIRREGPDKLTARAIAKELGASTMPVYSTIDSMDTLKDLIADKARSIAAAYRNKILSRDVLTAYAMGHILLAQNEPVLFRLVWLDKSWEKHNITCVAQQTLQELKHTLSEEGKYQFDCKNDFMEFISIVWAIVHGLAINTVAGTFLTDNLPLTSSRAETHITATFDRLFQSYRTAQ